MLLFDFRGYSASQEGGEESLPLDVSAAVKEARLLGARKVLLVGASMGGWSVVMAAPTIRPQVQGVVAVSAPTDWSGSAVKAARRLTPAGALCHCQRRLGRLGGRQSRTVRGHRVEAQALKRQPFEMDFKRRLTNAEQKYRGLLAVRPEYFLAVAPDELRSFRVRLPGDPTIPLAELVSIQEVPVASAA